VTRSSVAQGASQHGVVADLGATDERHHGHVTSGKLGRSLKVKQKQFLSLWVSTVETNRDRDFS
jgi:hypothetical protein